MASFPAQSDLNGTPTQATFKTAIGNFLDTTKQIVGGQAETELTIASGSITPTHGLHSVDTESDAATDDLANITTTNLDDGSLLIVRANNSARTVVVKHTAGGAGQIHLKSGLDLTLDDDTDNVILTRRGADWYELVADPDLVDADPKGSAAALALALGG